MPIESCHDPRTDFFTAAISSATGLPSNEVSSVMNGGDNNQRTSIDSFLEDKDCPLLVVVNLMTSGGNLLPNLHISNNITSLLGKNEDSSSTLTSVIFLKPITGNVLDVDSFKSSIMVISTPNYSLATITRLLRSTLHNVFIPALSMEEQINSTITTSLEELDVELASSSIHSSRPVEETLNDHFNAIHTPMDEIQYWYKVEKESRNPVISQGVKEICQNFESNEIQDLFKMLTDYSRQNNNVGAIAISNHTLTSIDLSYLTDALGDDGILEATLLNLYEVCDIEGNPIYSIKVRNALQS